MTSCYIDIKISVVSIYCYQRQLNYIESGYLPVRGLTLFHLSCWLSAFIRTVTLGKQDLYFNKFCFDHLTSAFPSKPSHSNTSYQWTLQQTMTFNATYHRTLRQTMRFNVTYYWTLQQTMRFNATHHWTLRQTIRLWHDPWTSEFHWTSQSYIYTGMDFVLDIKISRDWEGGWELTW